MSLSHTSISALFDRAIEVLDELEIVSNQNLSIEMFLTRLVHLSGSKKNNEIFEKKNLTNTISAKSGLELKKENAINIETGGPKLILKDTTDDDDQQINFVNNSGVTDYMIRTSDPTGGGGGDGFYIGSVQSDGEVALFTHNTTALTLDTSQNATFAAGVTVTGNITASNNISASGDIRADGRIFEKGTSVIDHATAMAIVFGG